MKVFYIKKDEFKNRYDKDFISRFVDKELKSEKRFYEYAIGRFLVKTVAKKCYDIANPEILIQDRGKPVFKSEKLCFNISHSKNIVIACFDDYPCGIDIEFIKERDLVRFSEYYGKKFESADDFYAFWTQKEAAYKIDAEINDSYSCKFESQYFLTIVSNKKVGDISFLDALSVS